MSVSLKRAAAGCAAALTLATGATVLSSIPAQAASYNGVCGSGYSVIDRASVSGGTVFLTYNNGTGKNCVVTVRNTPGARMFMAARVSLAAQPWISDTGQFTTYAGPVYVSAQDRCIDWGGSIGDSTWAAYGVHCG